MKPRLIHALLILLIVGGVLACGCTSSPESDILKINVHVNSAEKAPYIVSSSGHVEEPSTSGKVFLIVDFSITNTRDDPSFYFSPTDTQIKDENNYSYDYSSMASYYYQGEFSSGKIFVGDTRRGQLVFEVPEDTTSYTFYINPLWDNRIQTDLGYIAPPVVHKNAKLTIGNIDTSWYNSLNRGTISYIDVTIENTGQNAILEELKYDIVVKRGGSTVISATENGPYLAIVPEESVSDTIYMIEEIYSTGTYTVTIDLKDGTEKVGTASKTISIS